MPKLKFNSGDGGAVPGKAEAERERETRGADAPSPSANLPFSSSRRADVGPDYTYSKIRLHKKDEVNIYAEEQDARYAIDPRLKKLIVLGVACAIVFLLVCIMPTQFYHRAQFGLAIWLSECMQGIQNLIGAFANPGSAYATYALTIVVTLLAGAAMALSGGIFQGSLKNVLASPSTLGVTNGGAIGAIIYSVFIYPTAMYTQFSGGTASDLAAQASVTDVLVGTFGGFACSLVGCGAVVTLVMAIAVIAGRGKVSNVALVVAGQVFASTITIVLNYVRLWLNNHGNAEAAAYLVNAQTMSFTGAYTLTNVLVFAVPVIVCMVICFRMSGKLTLLAFKDDEARSMGISTTRTRYFMVAICTIMTALVVSFCGMVGFVGLVAPYIARKLIGPDFRYLLPACALIGALMVTAVFYVTQIGIPYLIDGSTGVITSVIGSVAFLVIAIKERRSHNGDWI